MADISDFISSKQGPRMQDIAEVFRAISRDDRYTGMTREEAWVDYHERHPEVLASWGEQNGRGYGLAVGCVIQRRRAVSALPVIATNATTAPFAQAGKEDHPTHTRNLSLWPHIHWAYLRAAIR